MRLRALVPTGHGINCERETAHALSLGGFDEVDQIHLNFLVRGDTDIGRYQLIAFPGGFLDGDDLGAAQACANRLRHSRVSGERLIDRIEAFVRNGGLVLGICNGFQLLVKLGMLPALGGDYRRRDVTLTHNDSGRFENRWVHLTVDPLSPCIFTKGITSLYLPVRHGEGKIIGRDSSVVREIGSAHQAPLRYSLPGCTAPTTEYPFNPNGAEQAIAGICDGTGRVFGLMPHPEAYLHRTNHPRWTREDLPEEGGGLMIFRNAARFLN
ncbi:MAG: phosphoribosylformylglycinamidine synthase subunit PurQ [Pseudomonadota bacterium]